MKINDISNNFGQLIVSKPTPELQASFARRLAPSRSGPKLMFHGTPLRNLRSILREGFKGGMPGYPGVGTRLIEVWVAEEPGFSVSYALKETTFGLGTSAMGRMMGGILKGMQPQPQTPYDMYGVVLGCAFQPPEQAGKRGLPRTAVTNDIQAVMVRYVFLVPPNAVASMGDLPLTQFGLNGPMMPERVRIERQMMENIREITRNGGKSRAGNRR
jgi:hypothetical protein